MRSAERQIRIIREKSGQIDWTYDKSTGDITAGLTQDFYVEALNEAQDFLQQQIIALKSDLFLEDEVVSLVANQEEYSLTNRIFGNTKIKSAQYSSSGQVTDYAPFPSRTLVERNTTTATDPSFYIPLGTDILVNPVPSNSQGTIRITSYKELDDLDIRRGTISGPPSGTSIIMSTTDLYEYDLSQAEYICVCDKFGNSILRGGKVSSYDTGTHTFTLAANVSTYLVAGYALADLANKYVTMGRYSTTHSQLPDTCERYLLTYAQKRAMQKEEQTGAIFEDSELRTMLESILGAYSEKTEDVLEIPMLDPGIMF